MEHTLGGRLRRKLVQWFDAGVPVADAAVDTDRDRVDWARIVPFAAMHVACLGVFFVGVSAVAAGTAAALAIADQREVDGRCGLHAPCDWPGAQTVIPRTAPNPGLSLRRRRLSSPVTPP